MAYVITIGIGVCIFKKFDPDQKIQNAAFCTKIKSSFDICSIFNNRKLEKGIWSFYEKKF